MPTYTPAQVAAAMRRAGFPESQIATGVAVATAESGRRSEATNLGTKEKPEHSIGPWQINLNAHGQAIDERGARNLTEATDYAYTLWKSSGWKPWGAYKRGTYRAHLPVGQQAVAEPRDLITELGGRYDVEGAGGRDIIRELGGRYDLEPNAPDILGQLGARDEAGRPLGGGVVFPVEGFTAKDVPKHWDVHRGAADLFAPQGTPVKAMRGGTVTSVGSSGPGGNNIQVQGDDGLQYYYAHLNDFGPGLERGGRVEAGQVLGGVGDTGNAKGKGHHLHIGIGKSIASGTGAAGGAGTDFDATTYLNQALQGGGGGVEPRTPGGSTGLAANYLERARTDLEGASNNIAQVHDPTWRSDFIARKQHDPAFRAAALKKYAPRYTDIDDEEAWDAAAKAADDEIQLETNRRQAAYEKAKDDLKAALSLPSETEQDLDLRLKIAQLDKALNPPGPQRTPEQRQRDIAAAQESVFRTEALLPAQAAEARARTARIPAQAERDLAAAEKAAAETAKIQRDLIPKQQLVLQEGWQTIARIKDELASGRITPQEADQYYTSVQQYVTSGLRGSTPAAEDKLRIQEATKRAQIGKDILNQQVQSGTALAGNLNRDYQQLLAKTLEPPGEYDPLQRASLFTAGMGGGLQNPSTLDISGQLIGGLAGGGGSQLAPQAGVNWAQDYPGVPLASAVPAGAGMAEMGGGEEIPEDAEMSAEDYSRILAEVFTDEEDLAEDEEEFEE